MTVIYALFFTRFCITKTLHKRKIFSLLFNCSHSRTSKLYFLTTFPRLAQNNWMISKMEGGAGKRLKGDPQTRRLNAKIHPKKFIAAILQNGVLNFH